MAWRGHEKGALRHGAGNLLCPQRNRDQDIALHPRKNYAYSAITTGYDKLGSVLSIVPLEGFLTTHLPYVITMGVCG
jgi:hypothetical protein